MYFFVYVFVVLLNPSGCSMEKDAGAVGTDAGKPRRLEGHPRKRERERVVWTRLVTKLVVRSVWVCGGGRRRV